MIPNLSDFNFTLKILNNHYSSSSLYCLILFQINILKTFESMKDVLYVIDVNIISWMVLPVRIYIHFA